MKQVQAPFKVDFITFSKLLQRHGVRNPFEAGCLEVVVADSRYLLAEGVHEVAHYACEHPISPVFVGHLNNVVVELIGKTLSCCCHQRAVLVHVEEGTVVGKLTLQFPGT